MSLEHDGTPVLRALLEQPGPDQEATLILAYADGTKPRFRVRPGEAKLLLLLRDARTEQTRQGFTEAGWVRLSTPAGPNRRRTPSPLRMHLYRLRLTLGAEADHVVQSDPRRGVRLLVDLEFLGNAGLTNDS